MTPNETLVRLEMLMAASQAHFVAWCNGKRDGVETAFHSGHAWTMLNKDVIDTLGDGGINVDPVAGAGEHTYCEHLRVSAYFEEAIILVRALEDPIPATETAAWMSWMTRWLYGAEHRLAIIQPGLGTSAKESALQYWRRWAQRQYRAGLGLSQDPVQPGPAELLEQALLEGPLREVVTDPDWRVAWAASALQEQNLLIFKLFNPDRALMHDILAVARPLVVNGRLLSDKVWQEHSNRVTDPPVADFLWLEWAHNQSVRPATLLAMVEAGISPFETSNTEQGWLTLIQKHEDFEQLLPHIDPLDARQPFEVRLNAFRTLGPAACKWDSPSLLGLAREKADWLLPYAKQRWLTWNAEEQQLAVESWQAQALSGMTHQGIVVQNIKSRAKALDDIQAWQTTPGTEVKEGQLFLEMLHGHAPLPRWVFSKQEVSTFSVGLCWAALCHMTLEEAKKLDVRFLIRPAHEPPLQVGQGAQSPDDVWRFLFALGTTDNLGAYMRCPIPGVEGGVLLGEVLHNWLAESEEEERSDKPKVMELAACTLLALRARSSSLLDTAGWEGLTPYLPEVAAVLLKRKQASLSYMMHWIGEQPPGAPKEAILQAHTLLRMLAMAHQEDAWTLLPTNVDVVLNRLKTLLFLYPQLGPEDDDPSAEGVWTLACAARPELESLWRSANLRRALPEIEETKCATVRF